MFYAHFVLAKKGPLARIWLAAHWDKKLTKAHVFETNIESSVEGILQPKVKMALRTSGHLLLGIVRIYSRKAKYLLADCNEAFIKIKMAFRPGVVDLPEENREAAVHSITLPEVFHDFDTGMPDLPAIDMEAAITLNQSRAEDITLKEDYGMGLMNDEEQLYADMSFDTDAEIGRDATNLDFDSQSVNLTANEMTNTKDHAPSVLGGTSMAGQNSLDAPLNDDGFGGNLDSAGLDLDGGANQFYGTGDGSKLEPAGLFDDTPMSRPGQLAADGDAAAMSDSESDMYDMGPGGSMGVPSPPSSTEQGDDLDDINVQPPSLHDGSSQHTQLNEHLPPMTMGAIDLGQLHPQSMAPPAPREEPETFTLAPLDTTAIENAVGPSVRRLPNRKRKLIIDEVKNISGEEMKAQLSDTSDIVTTLDLAPPTKRLMHWKETGGVEKLFSLPAVENRHSKYLHKVYQGHLVTKSVESDESLVQAPVEDPVEEMQEMARDRAESRLEDTTSMLLPPETPAAKRSRMEDVPPTPGRDFNEMPGGYQHAPATDYGAPYTPFTPAPPTPAHTQENFSNSFQPNMSLPSEDMSANFDSLAASQGAIGNPPSMAPPPTPMHGEMGAGEALDGGDMPHHDDTDATDEEDYAGPMSVGPHEEQAADETFEQFEERIQNKRTVQMLSYVRPSLDSGKSIRFSELVRNNNRKQVAQKFYTFLVLKKQQACELSQETAYSEVFISAGPKYQQALLGN